MRISFDIDDTVVNFTDPFLKHIKNKYDIVIDKKDFIHARRYTNLHIAPPHILRECIDDVIANIRDLKPVPGAFEFIRKYHLDTKDTIIFITRRWDVLSTKMMLDLYMDNIPYRVFHIERDKYDMIKENKIDFYIEDNVEIVEELEGKKNLTVFFLDREKIFYKRKFKDNVLYFTDWEQINNFYVYWLKIYYTLLNEKRKMDDIIERNS